MLATLTTMWGYLSTAAPFLKGKADYPKLQNENGPLPLHYMQHCRATPGNLGQVWKDGHTICDDQTGIPVARWSYAKQEIENVVGFTVQGLPVYENVPPEHAVWSTPRPVPEHLGSPGSAGITMAYWSPLLTKPVQYRRGDKLASYLGMYGPIGVGMEAPESGSGPGTGAKMGAGSILVLGGIAAIVAGATIPGVAALGMGLVMSRSPASGGRGWGPGEGPPQDPGAWVRPPGMSDEEAEEAWAEWLRNNPSTGRG